MTDPRHDEAARHRMLFYSHDSFGLGHFRRSLTIASFLARHIDDLSVLMLTGIDSPAAFERPRGVDFVKLPSIWKSGPDQYRSRHLRVSFTRVRRVRQQLIRSLVRVFDPALVVIDNVPRGVRGELLSTLRFLRQRRPATRIVLTLRDVLDAPDQIVPHWRRLGVYDVLHELYDEIWVAGCRAAFDPIQLYELPPRVAAKVRFCGYVVRGDPAAEVAALRQELRLREKPLVIVSCGGGGDGAALIDAYVEAVRPLLPTGLQSGVFLGPDMPAAQRRELKRKLLPLSEQVFTFDFRPDLVAFLQLATATVSMAGYNTLSEVVSLGKRALVVPRVAPRVEQLLRAEAFARHGLVRVLPPDRLDPVSLRNALLELLEAPGPVPPLPPGIDFGGQRRIARRVRKHLGLGGAA
jgi:predicted glycosyltransferase